MRSFFNIRAGDKIKAGKSTHWQTVIGKSLGRNWSAVRTNHGLIEVLKTDRFEVKK